MTTPYFGIVTDYGNATGWTADDDPCHRLIMHTFPTRVKIMLAVIAAGGFTHACASEDPIEDQLVYAYELFLLENPSDPLSAELWQKLGNIYLHQGHYDDARKAYGNVIRLAVESPDHDSPERLAAELGIGLSLSAERRFDEAVVQLRKAADNASSADVSKNMISVYRELTSIGLRTDDYVLSFEYASHAQKIYKTLGYLNDEADMLLVMGVSSAQQGNMQQARELLKKSFHILTEIDNATSIEQASRVVKIANEFGIDSSAW